LRGGPGDDYSLGPPLKLPSQPTEIGIGKKEPGRGGEWEAALAAAMALGKMSAKRGLGFRVRSQAGDFSPARKLNHFVGVNRSHHNEVILFGLGIADDLPGRQTIFTEPVNFKPLLLKILSRLA
jgi:hypothetical protein